MSQNLLRESTTLVIKMRFYVLLSILIIFAVVATTPTAFAEVGTNKGTVEANSSMTEKESPTPVEITREVQRNMQLMRNLDLYVVVDGVDSFTNSTQKKAMLASIKSLDELIEEDAVTAAITKLYVEVLSKVDGGSDDFVINDPEDKKLIKNTIDDFLKSLNDSSTPIKQLTGKKDYFRHPSPKAQQDAGVSPADVQCNGDLKLVFKKSNGNAACVKELSVQPLKDLGWARK